MRRVVCNFFIAACDPHAHPKSRATELSPGVFDDARNCLRDILAANKHRDGPRVLALLRPLTRHSILRERILTLEILEMLVKLLDVVVMKRGGNFGQAMDTLNCLLQCGALVIIVHLISRLRFIRGHPAISD